MQQAEQTMQGTVCVLDPAATIRTILRDDVFASGVLSQIVMDVVKHGCLVSKMQWLACRMLLVAYSPRQWTSHWTCLVRYDYTRI